MESTPWSIASFGDHALLCTPECGLGWLPLLSRLLRWWASRGDRMIVHAIREKWGALDVDAQPVGRSATWDDERMIRHVGYLSERTCEQCGRIAFIRSKEGWLTTRCTLHSDGLPPKDDASGPHGFTQDCDRALSWMTEWGDQALSALLPPTLAVDHRMLDCIGSPDANERVRRLQDLLRLPGPYRPIHLPELIILPNLDTHHAR